ncbi:alpha-methylacyl-CoA racemase [Geosmithia morbida]|uniref:Alpha-methylacyl-CoA racemase n=1 Tax=Geosmithia morbida TaxID=1094350 RepID=A0A9P5CXT5_9HYPO|nr:alpha-methylacyl-CoA racemase [Geosmithia morbida]KAF4119643.1 alpha-methylacyl-CoA racemase [Geosmithia morbida]
MTSPPPLQGIKVLEFAGLAPGPFAGMLLSDAGASVLRIDRPIPGSTHTAGSPPPATADMLARRKTSIAVDLKAADGAGLIRRLASHVDVLIDPFRPGVLERLGLGPGELRSRNRRLVYARMTGFRRDGRYAAMAGHDINYLAVSGALSLLGREGSRPHAPWNMLADFAGGGAALFQGILMALVARAASGSGQVVEANMVDGASYLATFPRMALRTPIGDRPRGRNLLDGGRPWYDTYPTRDGGHMAVGALEPRFFAELLRLLGLAGQGWEEARDDEASWPELRAVLEATFRRRTRAEWEAVFDGSDACCTPVLDYRELHDQRGAREGDQRPVVGLEATPCLAISSTPHPRSQGDAVPGEGYVGVPLGAGEGGRQTLRDWAGWEGGREYDVVHGGLVLVDASKL